jgi:acyl-CoA thioester hydrolase
MNQYPSVAAVRELPVRLRRTVTPEWLDYNNHMNVRHHFELHVATVETFWAEVGVAEAYHASGMGTVFTLEQQFVYLAEVHGGDELTTHARAVARSEKVLSMVAFVVNETHLQVSSVMHMVGGHIDLETRRMSEFPAIMSARIDSILDQQRRLDWPAPLSSATAVRV